MSQICQMCGGHGSVGYFYFGNTCLGCNGVGYQPEPVINISNVEAKDPDQWLSDAADLMRQLNDNGSKQMTKKNSKARLVFEWDYNKNRYRLVSIAKRTEGYNDTYVVEQRETDSLGDHRWIQVRSIATDSNPDSTYLLLIEAVEAARLQTFKNVIDEVLKSRPDLEPMTDKIRELFEKP